ncbi:RCC1 domain-containing protein [Arcanobacterium bovis]|uniref:Chromosome condensation regulator RCC1 n=1 Tax=Arcanobacterium bovis TaxID=2529275 RepID=A0A4Q9UYQ0_9ACTO|nr:hypothetical protein [Arcanobacterium bovis]TBW20684.1 hypothetical protein EZJ44_08555 [Arcanobacterium bovis]
MLDKKLPPENLYRIAVEATSSDLTPELLHDLETHPNSWPALGSWARYIFETGDLITPPQPTRSDSTDEDQDSISSTRTRKRFEGRRLRVVGIIAGSLVIMSVAGFAAYQAFARTDTPAEPAPLAVPAKPAVEDPLGGLTATGASFTCNAADKTIICIGQNTLGQLGSGAASSDHVVKLVLDEKVEYVSAGADFACAATASNVTCWGDNRWRQAGDTDTQVLPPTKVPLAGKNIEALATGDVHACAIASSKLYCWGSDYAGQLGSGKQGVKASGVKEIKLPGDDKPVSVKALRFGTCASSSSGKLYCWGANNDKRLSDDGAPVLGITEMKAPTTGGVKK